MAHINFWAFLRLETTFGLQFHPECVLTLIDQMIVLIYASRLIAGLFTRISRLAISLQEPINISSDCKHCTEEAVQLHYKKSSQVVKLTYPAVISAGSEHTIALAASGSPYSWGLARLGALGQNNTTCQSSPKQLSRTHAERTVAAAAGSHHTMTLTEVTSILDLFIGNV